ncbi:hypothetical protein EJ07DRAFT_158316 [Lizonia empirigonia]|nr:hypothetical protein EJ07DRAFT_158316 [Lizonia empirigonia]
MVLRHPSTSCNNGLPIPRPSPAPTCKDNRCFECQLGSPPDTHQTACLHQNEFAPTPNRFSILAGLAPSPEAKWAFDFVPTARPGTKRRGKRGGKQQRLKHALKKTCEKPHADSLDELCHRVAALRLDGDDPTEPKQRPQHELQLSTPSADPASCVNTVRHHWAPQFRPDSLPISTPDNGPRTLSLQPQLCLPPPILTQDSRINSLPNVRRRYPRFPLPAFLRDLTTPDDCLGYWPPATPAFRPLPHNRPDDSAKSPASTSSSTSAQSAAAAAAYRALVLSKSTTPTSSNAVMTHQAVPTTQPLPTDTATTYERFPAFGAPSSTPPRAPVPTISPALVVPPATRTPTATPTSPTEISSPVSTPVAQPINSRSFTESVETTAAPVMGQSSTARPSRPPAPKRSPWGWQEFSEGITVFHTSPSTLTTAPVTSPYPFVYPPQPWTPTDVSKDLFKDTAAVPSSLRRKLAFSPPSPAMQKELQDFLDLGHADDCWCSSSKHLQLNFDARIVSTTVDASRSMSPHEVTQGYKGGPLVADPDAVSDMSSTSDNLPDLQNDLEDSSSDSDVVLISHSPEGTSSVFEDFAMYDGDFPCADSDDDEWIAVSPRLGSRRPGFLPSSWTVSNTSVQMLNSDSVVVSPATFLPSPPQTPCVLAYQARVSDAESEIE